MARESVIILFSMGASVALLLIGAVIWCLKKKGGIFIAAFGSVALIVTILCIPSGDGKTQPEVTEPLNFTECYYAYKENELKADDIYKGNRYSLTVKVRDIKDTDGSLLYWDDEVIVGFEIKVDDVTVVGEAVFEKDQRDFLKKINVGDTVTFVGECQSVGVWIGCELQ